MAVIKTIGNVKFSTPVRCNFKVEGVNASNCRVTALGATIDLTGNTNTAVRYVHYRYECGTIVTSSKHTKLNAKKYPDIHLASGDFSFLHAVGARTLTVKLMAAVTTSTTAPTSGWTEIGSGTASIPAKSQYTLTYSYKPPDGERVYDYTSQTRLYNVAYTVPTMRTGYYAADKWSYALDAETPAYTAGDTIKITRDTTLYAFDVDYQYYTCRFYPNSDGDFVKDIPGEQLKPSRLGIRLSDLVPKRPGYRFLAWTQNLQYTEGSLTIQPGSWYDDIETWDANFWAIWEPCIKVYSDGEWKDGLAYAWVGDEWLQADEQQVNVDEEWKT